MPSAGDRPAMKAPVRPREPSKRASGVPRRRKPRERLNCALVGTTRKITISRTKTSPPASACGKTSDAKNACGKAGKCRGGAGFLGGRIGTGRAAESVPRMSLKSHTHSTTRATTHTPASARQSPFRGGWRISINTSSQQGTQALYLASIVFEQLNQ